jgi:hypothetical protein
MRNRLMTVWLAPVLLACSSGSVPEAGPPAGVAVERQRWESAGVATYRFDFEQQCFCVREQVQPVTIEVRDGAVTRVVSRETGADITAVEGLRWPTIGDLFRVMEEAARDGITPLVVRYDPELGYPTHIEAGSLAADAGIIYTASNLEVMR